MRTLQGCVAEEVFRELLWHAVFGNGVDPSTAFATNICSALKQPGLVTEWTYVVRSRFAIEELPTLPTLTHIRSFNLASSRSQALRWPPAKLGRAVAVGPVDGSAGGGAVPVPAVAPAPRPLVRPCQHFVPGVRGCG